MRYTDLIFDLYGTLVDIHTDENDLVWEKTALYFGFYGARYTPGELKDAFRATMDRWGSEAGQDYECFPQHFDPAQAHGEADLYIFVLVKHSGLRPKYGTICPI